MKYLLTSAGIKNASIHNGPLEAVYALMGGWELVHIGGSCFLVAAMDDRRWTMMRSSIVHRLSSMVRRTSNELPRGCTSSSVHAKRARSN